MKLNLEKETVTYSLDELRAMSDSIARLRQASYSKECVKDLTTLADQMGIEIPQSTKSP